MSICPSVSADSVAYQSAVNTDMLWCKPLRNWWSNTELFYIYIYIYSDTDILKTSHVSLKKQDTSRWKTARWHQSVSLYSAGGWNCFNEICQWYTDTLRTIAPLSVHTDTLRNIAPLSGKPPQQREEKNRTVKPFWRLRTCLQLPPRDLPAPHPPTPSLTTLHNTPSRNTFSSIGSIGRMHCTTYEVQT